MMINERVRYLRKEVLHLSQAEFYGAAHLNQTAGSMIEHCQRAVTERTADAICQYWGVRSEWLATGEGEIFRQLVLPAGLRGLMPGAGREAAEQAVLKAYLQLDSAQRRAFLEQFS